MQSKTVIAIVGTGREIEPAISNARKLGELVAVEGWVLITGGRDAGVMRAANDGAKKVPGSMTVGILPDRNAPVARSVDVPIITGVGHARNNIIVLSADVVIACGVEGAGTASEVSLALKNKKHVVLVDVNDTTARFFAELGAEFVHLATSPSEAIETVKLLLRNAERKR